MSVAAIGLSFALAALLGFAAHRSSVCTVKAVVEMMTTGRAHMLASFWQAALWVMAIDLVVYWASGARPIGAPAVPLSVWPFVGGTIFGIGAAMNQGCAFSTLNKLGGGNLGMAVTLAGFGFGAAMFIAFPVVVLTGPVEQLPSLLMRRQDVAALLTIVLSVWAIRQAWRLWRGRPGSQGFSRSLLSGRYRLSTGAALIGLSAGTLFAVQGAWLYTSTIQSLAATVFSPAAGPSFDRLLLFVAVLVGVGLSVWQRRAFQLQVPGAATAARHFMGGMMMGTGAAMIPGGNDVLVLQTIPLLLPHAILAYLGVLFGIYLIMAAMKLRRQEIKRLDCSGDICWDD
jgi:uncharacterized membrane protein YedE/YeeE